MGKVIKKKIQGMSWWMKTSLVLLLTLTTTVFMYQGWYKPMQASAAIARVGTATVLNNATAATGTVTIPATTAGNLLVVVISGGAGATGGSSAVNLGATAMTKAIQSFNTAGTNEVTIWYLANIPGGQTTVTWSYAAGTGGTLDNGIVVQQYSGAATVTPVDVTATWNSGATAVTVLNTGTATATAANELWIGGLNNLTTGTWSAPTPAGSTIQGSTAAGATGMALVDNMTLAAGANVLGATCGPTSDTGVGAVVVFKPAVAGGNLNITNGTDPVSANAPQASTGNAMDAFSVFMSAGSGTINTLTLTGGAQFLSSNVSAIKIYRDNGVVGLLDAPDVLVATTTAWAGSTATITFTTPEAVTTATGNYLVVVDVTPGAVVGNTLTGRVTAATGAGLGTPVYGDTASATLTITAGPGLTVGNGAAVANANAPLSSTNNALDSFTMVSSLGTTTVNTLTLTGSANFTAANIANIKVYADNAPLGVFGGSDVLIPTTYSAIAGNATTITFTTPESVSTTVKNYLVVVDIAAGATTGQAFTGTITAGSGAYVSSTFSNTLSATLTITPIQTLTVGNGINPVNANIATGGTAALDAFTLALNTGSGTINTLTLTGGAQFTTANIASVAVYADNGIIGTYQAGIDTLVPTTYAQAGTVGTITFTTPEPVTVTAKNYLVMVTAAAGATAGNTFTGTITAATGGGLGTPVYGDATSAILTVVSGPIATIGTCGGCHFYTGIAANLPQDGTARNTPVGQFVGSHGKHSNTYGYACSKCHRVPATTTTADNMHQLGTVNMSNPINGNPGAMYGNLTSWTVTNTPAFKTCNTTNCHGQKSPVWGFVGNANACLKCHGQLAGAFVNFSSANVAPGGAGQDTGGNTLSSSARVGTHQQHLLAQSNLSLPIHCGECHTVHTTVGDPTHLNYTTATITFQGPLSNTAGLIPSVSRVSGVINCNNVYCHTAKRPAGTGANQRGTAGSFVTWTFNGTALLDNTTVLGTCANKCHGLPPGGGVAGDTHAALLASGSYTTPASLAACSSNTPATGCHPSIAAAPTSMATIFANKSLHIDGVVEGGSCTGCHSSSQVNRVAVAAQFTGAGNSHHYQGAAPIDGKTCYACHWEANSDGSINALYHKATANVELVVWNATTRPTTYTAGVTAQQYLSGGNVATARAQIANINKNCLGCHNATNAATTPFSAGGDNFTPVKYAWDALSIDARYSQIGTTPWGKFSGNDVNTKSLQTKAYSAHGNAVNNVTGWSTVADTFPTTGKATSNVMCFDCHNSHGSTTAAAGITSSYSSATGRRMGGILKDTTAGKGGYTLAYKPAAGGLAANKNMYNSGAGLCFDCHMTATATAAIPWGYSGDFGFTPPVGQTAGTGISGYFDTPYFGQATFQSNVTYPYKAGKATNMGGHLTASFPLTTAVTQRAFDPATPSGTVIQGLCTPCHDPHGVSSSLGANQQYGVPLLKGTWVTTPYKQDSAPANINENRGGSNGRKVPPPAQAWGSTPVYYIDQKVFQAAVTGKPATAKSWNFATAATTLQTTNDTQFAGLCTGCHAKAVLNSAAAATSANWKTMTRIHNSVNGWAAAGGGNAGNSRHAYTCSKCHTAHNSRLPRLLVTNCLDVKHRGRVASGGNMAASNTQKSTSGAGSGRFPAGGGGSASVASATNPGPWFFGKSNGTSSVIPAVQSCHDSATAGGAAYSTGAELWNTQSPW